jgi:hypothetical protein
MLATLAAILLLTQGTTSPYPVKPSETDPAIKQFDDPHLIYFNAAAKPRNQLFVFLPGTNGKPGGTNLLCQTAADLGYHTIALAYPTDMSATAVRNDPDPKAFENFRLEIIEGRDVSPAITVDRTNCIENRLIKLLQYLAKDQPGKGWDRYLTANGELNWSQIAFSGQSQGGGHAVLIAFRHRVARAICTGGPKDFDRVRNEPAAWYHDPATPISLIFTFNHELDEQGCDIEEQYQICKKMGLYEIGPPVSVDKNSPPYKSRILTTNFLGSPTDSVRAHTSVSGDRGTPKDTDGKPIFRKVWEWMMTAG